MSTSILAILSTLALSLAVAACQPRVNGTPAPAPSSVLAPQDEFWANLQAICGRAYRGRLTEGNASDSAFRRAALVMHVRQCTPSEIRIPFHADADRSRTWVLTRTAQGLRLKHDHRHADGSEDRITQYGGDTRAQGTAERQEVHADAHTAALIPAAATNVWTMELVPGSRFAYALRREGTDRRFRVEFDLTEPVPAPAAPWGASVSPAAHRLTVIVDAFGDDADLRKDWGYSALVESGGKRILFDTGNDSAIFAGNVRRLGVDLTRLDAVVISHRHADHTAGLRHVLRLNPGVKIYVPNDEAFGGPTPAAFFRQSDTTLPRRMRYFDGEVPVSIPHGSAWQGASFVRVDSTLEIAPGFRVVRNVSPTPPFNETPELSLVFDTAEGQVVVVGCSHPTIERILASVARANPRIAMVVGGLHWVTTPPAEIERITLALRDQWKIGAIAPGHCTGEVGFATLRRVFGSGYVYAGLGSVVHLTHSSDRNRSPH